MARCVSLTLETIEPAAVSDQVCRGSGRAEPGAGSTHTHTHRGIQYELPGGPIRERLEDDETCRGLRGVFGRQVSKVSCCGVAEPEPAPTGTSNQHASSPRNAMSACSSYITPRLVD